MSRAAQGIHGGRDDTEALLQKLLSDPRIQLMKQYTQHGDTSTYEHCVSVARESLRLNRALLLHADETELVKAALLHDYYLYDWHDRGHPLHGYRHADVAADNAVRDFGLDRAEEEAIRSHMWPLNISRIPHSRIGWIISLADKICSAKETVTGWKTTR